MEEKEIINKAAIAAKTISSSEIWIGTLGSEGTSDCMVYVPLTADTIIKNRYLFATHGLYYKCVVNIFKDDLEKQDTDCEHYQYVVLQRSWFPYIMTFFGSL